MFHCTQLTDSKTDGIVREDISMAKDKETVHQNEPRWAWVALLGCCYTLWFFGGVFRCMGIFYVAIMETFNSTPFETSLFSVTNMLIGIAAAPLAGIASDKFSLQTVMAVTSVTGTAGFVAAAFAPKLWIFIMCYALLTGFSLSAISLAVTVNVTKMFTRHRSFANGCLFASSSLGGMAMPSVYAYLLDLYTIRGTFIIIGALWFQQLAVAAMLTPRRIVEVQRRAAEAGKAMKKVSSAPTFTMRSEFVTSNGLSNSEEEGAKPKQRNCTYLNGHVIKDEEIAIVPTEAKVKTGIVNPTMDDEEASVTKNDRHDPNISRSVEKIENARPTQENADSSQNGVIPVEIQQESKEKKHEKKSFIVDVKDLLRMGVFWGLFFSFMFLNIGMMNTGLFLPAFGGERGISLVEYGILLSVGGAVSLFFNVFYGYIGDRSCTNMYLLLGMLTITCGSLISVLTFLTNKYAVYAILICIRIFGGVHLMYFAPMVIAAVGGKRTGTAIGLIRAPGRMGLAVAQLAFGSYREITGSYSDVIRLASFFYIAGGVFLVVMSSARMKNKFRKAFRSDIYVINS